MGVSKSKPQRKMSEGPPNRAGHSIRFILPYMALKVLVILGKTIFICGYNHHKPSMSFIFTLLAGFPNLLLPTPFGWAVWWCLLSLIVFLLIHWKGIHPAWTARSWSLFIGLLILVPITSLFIGIRLPAGSALPLPNFPADYSPGSSMMLFSAIPWTLAGGLLGPLGAALLGLFAGSCAARGILIVYSAHLN